MSTEPDPLEPPKQYSFHPLCEMFPLLEGDEFDNLVEDIEANGLLEVITVKDGQIVDGRNRYLACKTARYEFKDEDFVELPEGVDVLAFIVSKNIQRRHLTADGKRQVIAKLLESNPNSSSRAIAFLVRCSHHTVEDVRNEMAADDNGEADDDGDDDEDDDEKTTGQFAQLRTGRDGKKRRKATSKASAPPTHKELMKQVDDFKAQWAKLKDWQRKYFVMSRKDDIMAILKDIVKNRSGTVVKDEVVEQTVN